MQTRFRNRIEAGQLLARMLVKFANREDVLVLALPRGGVPVGYQIAWTLNLPLDVFVVRKLGVPGREELAFGAIASGGVRILNKNIIGAAGISSEVINSVSALELCELARREQAYRPGRPPLEVKGLPIILVDDGVATGSTMRAAIEALRQSGAREIVAVAPVVAMSTMKELQCEVDEFVALQMPDDFISVSDWYDDFSEVGDGEVRGLLSESGSRL